MYPTYDFKRRNFLRSFRDHEKIFAFFPRNFTQKFKFRNTIQIFFLWMAIVSLFINMFLSCPRFWLRMYLQSSSYERTCRWERRQFVSMLTSIEFYSNSKTLPETCQSYFSLCLNEKIPWLAAKCFSHEKNALDIKRKSISNYN